jgi:integrase/recombinase XerD
MEKIILKPAKHYNKKVMLIQFGYNDAIKNHLKKLKNIYWSKTLSSFYTDLSLESIKNCF